MIKKTLFFVFCFFISFRQANSNITFPKLTGQVVDEANILSYETEVKILQLLKPQQQFVVVTLNSLQGREIEDYSIELARFWGIGYNDKDDGLLLVIAPNERKVRIEVGYGLEHIMTDAKTSNIMRNIIIPAFSEGLYEKGIVEAVYQIQLILFNNNNLEQNNSNNFNTSYSVKSDKDFKENNPWFILLLVLFVYFVIFLFIADRINILKKEENLSSRKKILLKFLIFFRIVICFVFVLMIINALLLESPIFFAAGIFIPFILLMCTGGRTIIRYNDIHKRRRKTSILRIFTVSILRVFIGKGGSFGGGGSSDSW